MNTNEVSWVLSVVDLSVSFALGQNRERTLNFLSHDLRSPQASILALLDLHKKQQSATEIEITDALFKNIEFQVRRTLSLAEGFVQWSQASHGAAYQFTEYNLNVLMVEAIDELWVNAKQKNVTLIGGDDEFESVETDPNEIELWVRADRNLMWRAVVNLISNALNVSQAGTTIRLSSYQIGKYAVLAVTDQGPGISADLQARLFEPFAQGSGLKRTGAGLGLAFVKAVCDQHHGHVNIISPVFFAGPKSYGTCFELHLPLINTSVDIGVGADTMQ